MAVGLLTALGACADGWATTNVSKPATASATASRAPTPVDQIQIMECDVTDKPYKSLGDVSVTVNKVTIFNADPTRDAALGALLLLAACARNSPAPPDLSHLTPEQRLLADDAESPESKLDCVALKDERVIHGNRGQNQAAAFIDGAVFLPADLATKGDEDAKNLDQLQAQADRIDRLSKAKACPT